jgi:Pectinacetylesterase
MTYARKLSAMTLLAAFAALPARAETKAAQRCEATATAALTSCMYSVASAVRRCYLDTGSNCAPGDAHVAKPLAQLAQKVEKRCSSAAVVQDAGYGASATPATLVARLQESCAGEPATLAARTFGGPQGAILAGVSSTDKACLAAAHQQASLLLKTTARADGACIRGAHAGRTCDVARTMARVATAESKAQAKIGVACADLAALTGLDVPTFTDRAGAQARCMVATANGDTGPLTLDCGPRSAVSVPPLGQWVQVILDEATWGTRCGDGSSYAFWLKLAPPGAPPGRVVIDLQGGGVCIFESDCDGVPASLFEATDDTQPTSGDMSTDPSVNPFADWTQMFLPYCTQDVHIGGGTQSIFPSITVNRFGAINVRAALRYLRDSLWPTLQETTPEGYRPDQLTVVFGGESAGGFGAAYNYHYVLDDLRWAHTTAVPDSSAALDNGSALSVKNLGAVVGGTTNPLGWGTIPFQPPYCFASDCGVILPTLEAATSVRLKAVPEQQILNVSNQADTTQESTTFFTNLPSWIEALRTAYCDVKGEKGLHFWLPAQSTPFHTILTVASRFDTVTADGVTVADWLAGAMTAPDAVVDRVDEGTLVTDYPGVSPIACLGSPSGAFLDSAP